MCCLLERNVKLYKLNERISYNEVADTLNPRYFYAKNIKKLVIVTL